MKKLLILSSILILLVGCGKVNEAPRNKDVTSLRAAQVGDTVLDSEGRRYRKLTNENLTNGVGRVDIWERIDPLVTNRWYTPALSSRIFTNTIEFNSLYRGEDEKP